MRSVLLCAAAVTIGSALQAQTPRDSAQKTFFTRHDLTFTAAAIGASAAVSVFDERIARWAQSSHVQGDSARHDLANTLTIINETPLTLGAFALYGVGRLAGNETLADVGLHTTEALVLTVGLAEAIRAPLGRMRPREADGDAFHFKPGAGFTDFAARSYPSMHAAVAFATAAALSEETRIRNPEAAKFVTPLLYTAALVPGITRIYLNQHWTSDVVAGTLMGAFLGTRVVRYTHAHRKSRLDKALLGTTIAPDGRGGWIAGVSLVR